MAKTRVYEIAKKLGLENADVLAACKKLGIAAKAPASGLEPEDVEKVTKSLKKPPAKKAKAPAKKAPAKKPTDKKEPAKKAKAPEAKKEPVKKAPAKKAEKPVKKERPAAAAPKAKKARPAAKHKKAEAKKPAAAPKAKKARPAAKHKAEQKKPAPPKAEAPRPVPPQKQKPKLEKMLKKSRKFTIGTQVTTVAPAEAEEEELKVPDRFRESMEADKMEKFRSKATMQKAFQAIRKIEHRKFHPGAKKQGRFRGGPRHDARQQPTVTAPRRKSLKLLEGTTVKEFADLIGVKIQDLIKKFMDLGYMPTINQPMDMDAALLLTESMGIKLDVAPIEDDTADIETAEDLAKATPRPPIVTVMGHVDHGKTSLLDAIRETKVIETEAGGITQHIGAYKVALKGKEIVFLDTPGHEAFTTLRARGAKVTDIVILVVAADDGVKPQTIEAIDHAKAAGVPILVAVNKIDKPEANPTQVRNELAEHEIIPEDWGGKNIFAEISAKQRTGIEHLLEMVLLQAEVLELKANADRLAKGVIIEARLDKGRGPVATVLVQAGELKVGDAFLSGVNYGRVRALLNDEGKTIADAGPSTPAEVIGFSSVPNAGDTFAAMEDEKKARQIAMTRQQKLKSRETGKRAKLSLAELYEKIKEGQIKDLNIIVKADVHGSLEAIASAFEGITHPEVKVNLIHQAVGGVNESDVMLGSASDAIIMGFNVRADLKAQQAAEREGVDMRFYNVIYEAIDDVKKALEGMLEPTLEEKVIGTAEVRQVFQSSKFGTIAGSYVTDGVISRTSDGVRILRDDVVVFEGRIALVKRFKEDVKEVQSGYECGITIENYNDIKVGDVIENYIVEKVAAKL